MSGEANGADYGVCEHCGRPVGQGTAFVNTGPTDWANPQEPKQVRYVRSGADIHGWTPFVLTHPACWAEEHGSAALQELVDDAARLWPGLH